MTNAALDNITISILRANLRKRLEHETGQNVDDAKFNRVWNNMLTDVLSTSNSVDDVVSEISDIIRFRNLNKYIVTQCCK